MKELRAVVNAVFVFALFLIAYAFVTPGHVRHSEHPPRFLCMRVDPRDGDRVSLRIPYSFVDGAFRFAGLSRLRRELERSFRDSESIEATVLRDLWNEIAEKPPGAEASREAKGELYKLKKEGGTVALEVGRASDAEGSRDRVTLRLPARFVKSLVYDDRDLDVGSLVDELKGAEKGDLLTIDCDDVKLRIWVE